MLLTKKIFFQTDISHYTNKMNSLKESLQWGEDALFAWEEELAKGEKEMAFLKNYINQDDEKFQVIIEFFFLSMKFNFLFLLLQNHIC